MATKKAVKKATPAGDIEDAGKVVFIPLSRITINEAIAAREGAPDEDKVTKYAENFMERHAEGKEHQISPALVRMSQDGETYEVIDGRHRFESCKIATAAGDFEYMLLARVIPADDEYALVDAIQSNEFREDPNDFDRAAGIEKLIALGKSQVECATIYGLSEASISQIRKVGKLDKKYRVAIENGDVDRDAAIFIAGLEGDESAINEVFEEAIRHKSRMVDLETRMENRRLKALAQEKVDEAKQKVEEAKEEAAAKSAERKALEKSVKELEASSAKTKEVDELIKIREKQKALREEADRVAIAEKEQLAAAEKAAKLVEKAKAEQAKVKEQTSTKKAVTQEDAKAAAKEKGLKVKGGKDIKAPKTKQQFFNELEALAQEKEGDGDDAEYVLPEPVRLLIGKLQAFADGDDSVKQLTNGFLLFCKTEEQYEAVKAAKKRK